MAEETQPKPSDPEVPATAEPAADPPSATVEPTEPAPPATEEAVEAEIEAASGFADTTSFKEETNVVAELEDPEKKALDELKALLIAAIANNEFIPPPSPSAPTASEEASATAEAAAETAAAPEVTGAAAVAAPEGASAPPEAAAVAAAPDVTGAAATAETKKVTEEVFIWGVPFLGDEKSDTVLLKFLRARDLNVEDALAMIKNAVVWRKQFGIEALLEEEDLKIPELDRVVFNHGVDKEGHPVCYNVYGEFRDKELYAEAFGDEEKRERFLRWRIRLLEKGIRERLDFGPDAVSTMVQVTDLKNLPGPGKKELKLATKNALALLQDNYPEFVAKQVFINVPWWYLAYNRMISPFFTQRSKSKFVFAGPSKSVDTLFKYIAPEQVPVQYGGLSKDSDSDFSTADAVTEVIVKPASKHTVEIPATEGETLVWELRVLGWEVSYAAEFVPTVADGYTVIVQKARKFAPTDEPYVKNSFKIGEPGKVVLTVDNSASKKKKLLYRWKAKSSTESV